MYLSKVTNGNTETVCENCLKLTTNIPERRHLRRSAVFIVNFEQIWHIVLEIVSITDSERINACLELIWCFYICNLKVSENPFKQNNNILKSMKLPLYTYFYISLNVVRPTFFNTYNFPFSPTPNIGKIRVKDGPNTSFSTLWAPVPTDLLFSTVYLHWSLYLLS